MAGMHHAITGVDPEGTRYVWCPICREVLQESTDDESLLADAIRRHKDETR